MSDVELEGKTVLIGSPLSTKTLVPGSRVLTAACGHDVYVAPSGREALMDAGKDGVLMCMACIMTHPTFVARQKKIPPIITAKQREELGDFLGEDETERIMKTLGIKQQEV